MAQKDKIEKLFDFMEIAHQLKKTKRWEGVREMKWKETSADHSWSLAIFCLVVATEFDFHLNLEHTLKIALAHDLVEAITGDIASILIIKGQKSALEKQENELKAMSIIRQVLPDASGEIVESLWFEHEKTKTKEARFVMAMDKLESQVHMLCVGQKCFFDPSIMAEYTKRAVLNYPDLLPLNHLILIKKEQVYSKLSWAWEKKYYLDLQGRKQETEKLNKIFDFMAVAFQLKKTKRYLHTKEMKWKESSADHSWNVALLSFIVAEELGLKVDVLKSIKIALTHDLVEAIAGDTDYSLIAFGKVSKEEKYEAELSAIKKIRAVLPKKSGKGIYDLWIEYEEAKSPEARYIKALDKIEGIDHVLLTGHKCFDHSELIAPYPNKAVGNYPELKDLQKELNRRLKPEFKKLGWEWKKEYDKSYNTIN